MVDATAPTPAAGSAGERRHAGLPDNTYHRSEVAQQRLAKRYREENWFKAFGIAAISIAIAMLVVLLGSIISSSLPAFTQTYLTLDIEIDPEQALSGGDYDGLAVDAISDRLGGLTRSQRVTAGRLLNRASTGEIATQVANNFETMLDSTVTFDFDVGPQVLPLINGDLPAGLASQIQAADPLALEAADAEGTVPPGIDAAAVDEARLTRRLAQTQDLLNWIDSLRDQGVLRRVAGEWQLTLDIELDSFILLGAGDYQGMIQDSFYALFPEVDDLSAGDRRQARRDLRDMLSPGGGFELRPIVRNDPSLLGQTYTLTFPVSDPIDQLRKGFIDTNAPEAQRTVNDDQLAWYNSLVDRGVIEGQFNTQLFTGANSQQPELAGLWAAVVGSILTLFLCLILTFPIAVSAAVYLEEFAPKAWWTDIIEVNINNLAAVPSIVFGLLGLAVFIQFFGMPRSAPLVGGCVLALMTMPTIIIAGRAALKAVPPSIREAALGMGASRVQTVFHHVLPLAMPGILTGTIIGMAQSLGETAPLLMIGMVNFVQDVPSGFTSPATVLPVQIFMWASLPDKGFVAKTSAAIVVLLVLLVFMNAMAIWLRRRFERRW